MIPLLSFPSLALSFTQPPTQRPVLLSEDFRAISLAGEQIRSHADRSNLLTRRHGAFVLVENRANGAASGDPTRVESFESAITLVLAPRLSETKPDERR